MKVERAIEILNPEHRECYDGMDEVNEACRMGMEALERTRWIPCSERLPDTETEVLALCRWVATICTMGQKSNCHGRNRNNEQKKMSDM